MEATIIASTFMLGAVGAAHCTAMCAAPCAAVVGRGGGASAQALSFHGARVAGYAALGAVAAGGLGGLAALSALAPALRPLWVLVHAGLLVLGLWLLWQGRQPPLLAQLGRRAGLVAAGGVGGGGVGGAGWQPVSAPGLPGRPARRPVHAAMAGSLWFAWPCGLVQSAVLVAALSNSALGGAAAMGAFAVASSAGLWLAPALWKRLSDRGVAESRALRAAGALMALMSGWALTHGLWHRVAEYCATLF